MFEIYVISQHPNDMGDRIPSSCMSWNDGVIKWKLFPPYWPFVQGIHRSPVNSPHKSQWRGALIFSLICALINGWVNTREADDWRRHRAHYDVIVMGDNAPFMVLVVNSMVADNLATEVEILKTLNCLGIIKHLHFVSYLELYSTEEDQIYNAATLHVDYPILPISFQLMPWPLKGPRHQHAWYWSNEPEYSVSSIRRLIWHVVIQFSRNIPVLGGRFKNT